MMLIRKYS